MHYGLPLDWRRALVLESGDDVALLRQFMESLPWWELEPASGLLADPAGAILGCATVGRDFLVAYVAGPARITMPARTAGAVSASWFDPASGNTVSAGPPSSHAAAPLASPFGNEDAVLILRSDLS
jgi:hypothetical protein